MITLENLKDYFDLQEQNNPIVIASLTDLLGVIQMAGDTYTKAEIDAKIQEIKDTISSGIKLKDVVYGFRIRVEQDSSCSVSYLEDAIGATPAFMNFSNGCFNYGSWKKAFFMPRPCMLKFDGTVDYYLDPDDFEYRSDGVTPSDVANENYEGNAMIEWNKIYYKIVPLEGRDGCADIFISDHKADNDYVCYSFIDNNGNEKDHFYTPIYNGTVINGKLRSLSAKTHTVNVAENVLCNYAEANGDGWSAETYVDRVLINCLLVLMGKSLNSQKIYGYGHYTGGSSASSNYKTGLLNRRGMFWGSTGNTGVKVFGMENYYGEVWRPNLGVMNLKGKYYIKLHGPYNTTGEGYTEAGNVPNASASYITKMNFDNNLMLPIAVGGSENTYYADGMWSNNSQDDMLFSGGSSGVGLVVGAFTFTVADVASISIWAYGASCSYR